MSALLFLVPPYWPLLVLLPLGWLGALWLQQRRERRLHELLGRRAPANAGRPGAVGWRRSCQALALLGVLAALLRPVGVGSDGEDGADVIVVVDASWSMAARDVAPSRLGLVQQAIASLAAQAGRSRLGLVAYAGDASLRVPLTTDAAAVVAMADDLVPGALGRPGTDPGAAIALATAQLERAGRGGAIVLCSDGEDFTGGAADAAARAKAAGLRVFTFGCGEPGGSKIPLLAGDSETFLRDGAGQDVVTARDDARLAAIAAAGGGRFAVLDRDGLATLHALELLPAARAAAVRAGRLQPIGLQQWPLLIALVLLMLCACLPERVR